MKKVFAEFVGTFTLVLFACGTASVLNCMTSSADAAYLMTSLAFGLVIVAMAYTIGNVSGCHINPAVSLSMLLCGRMTLLDFIGYVVAQFAGALTGAAVLMMLLSSNNNLGQNGLYQASIGKSFAIEVILTCVFVLVILCVTKDKKYEKNAGLIIGLTLTLVHIFGIHFTGTSVNPARSFGPALLAGGEALKSVWVFILAPLVGAVVAVIIYKYLIEDRDTNTEKLTEEITEEATEDIIETYTEDNIDSVEPVIE